MSRVIVDFERVITRSLVGTDAAFAKKLLTLVSLASGTTALMAKAGDCRAILSPNGEAIEMSKDHRPSAAQKKLRKNADLVFEWLCC